MGKKKREPLENGSNIKAPRVFEEGEVVLFIQRIYGLSVCFGTGVIHKALDMPAGYARTEGDKVQYIIKGRRVFFHEGERHEETGTFRSWLGSASIVIVPRNERSQAWLKASMRQWKEHIAHNAELFHFMRFR